MNFKQREVLDHTIKTLQEKFPEVQLRSIAELNANSFWITVTEPSDEDQEMAMVELIGKLSTDALMDYGFDFQFVPTRMEQAAA